jgi:hypothetical protein
VRNAPVVGYVMSVQGPEEGRSIERTYTVRWTRPDGSTFEQSGVGCRQLSADEQIHRRAFPVGTPLFGLMLGGGAHSPVLLIDREDYAYGCDEPAASAGRAAASESQVAPFEPTNTPTLPSTPTAPEPPQGTQEA